MAKQTVAEKRDGEKLLVSEMIALYCRKNHHTAKGSLCPQCQALHDYALQRIERCPSWQTKTLLLRHAKVHCYKPEMREQIRTVMRWSGPAMLLRPTPLLARPAYEGNDEGEEELGVRSVGAQCVPLRVGYALNNDSPL